MAFHGDTVDQFRRVPSFTPAADANGIATITVRLHDDGGTNYGGVDYSAPQSFTITVNPVNDAPSFVKGADQTVPEDYGPQTVVWATSISAGPADEAGQALNFSVTDDHTTLFSVQPSSFRRRRSLLYSC